ncbi:hypothetical protein CONCODRAFT_77116 [Conidiobolus coronatus NRRL 28638]|uniref:Pentatricopeptide repeat-containing protein n=1 Tax=Conidiobolus coronatus (strain ATCC 28846 / CBS 209.66 / NRRL 28638) TaxID=796925 RepID=A0A137PG79_CONC2|nr:hypothetical protein CONCODRAFT_77116 [Conidiobolus coronatus NRRL 28638]|eukprot:KXN73985.1 hypothetical protein CONCODRAFT_77116 [Conidiobolus coronatus NRRL 28638]
MSKLININIRIFGKIKILPNCISIRFASSALKLRESITEDTNNSNNNGSITVDKLELKSSKSSNPFEKLFNTRSFKNLSSKSEKSNKIEIDDRITNKNNSQINTTAIDITTQQKFIKNYETLLTTTSSTQIFHQFIILWTLHEKSPTPLLTPNQLKLIMKKLSNYTQSIHEIENFHTFIQILSSKYSLEIEDFNLILQFEMKQRWHSLNNLETIWREINKLELEMDRLTYWYLIRGFGKYGRRKECYLLLRNMKLKSIQPTPHILNLMEKFKL